MAAISRAHASGDKRLLEKLQDEFRMSGISVTSSARGYRGTMAVIESAATRPTARTTGTRPAAAAKPWPTLVIGAEVRALLDSDLFDGAEMGGWLYGPIDQPEGEIHVTYAIEASTDETRHSAVLDLQRAVDVWAQLPANMTLNGCYHCHPNDSVTAPSTTDIDTWRSSARYFDKPWVGLVVRAAPTKIRDLEGRSREENMFEMHATVARVEGNTVTTRQVAIAGEF